MRIFRKVYNFVIYENYIKIKYLVNIQNGEEEEGYFPRVPFHR